MAYSVPAVNIFQQFLLDNLPNLVDLNTVFVGPNQFFLDCLDDAAEAALGAYAAAVDTTYLFPNRPAGAVVDKESVQLCMRQASLKYFPQDPGTDYGTPTGASLKAHGCFTNKLISIPSGGVNSEWSLRASCSPAHYFSALTQWPRTQPDFLNRDVKVGDIVRLKIHNSVGPVDHDLFSSTVKSVERVPMLLPLLDTTSGILAGYGNPANTSTGSLTSNVGARFLGLTDERWVLKVTALTGGTSVTFQCTNQFSGKIVNLTFTDANFATAQALGCNGVTLVAEDPSVLGTYVLNDEFYVEARVSKFAPTAALSSGSGVNALPVFGIYTGASDIAYTIEVIKSYAVGSPAQIQVRSSTGDSSGPINAPAAATPETWYPIGTRGLYFSLNSTLGVDATLLVAGQAWTLPVQSKIDGPYGMLVLDDDLPAAYYNLAATESIEISMNLLTDDLSPAADTDVWYVNPDGVSITVKAGISVPIDTFCDPVAPYTCPDLRVDAANMYLGYTAIVPGDGHIGVVFTQEEIVSKVGRIDPRNTLAQALSFGLGNTDRILYADAPELSTVRHPIYYFALQTNDRAGYQQALSILSNRTDMYCLIPLTFDRSVHADFINHVTSMSTPEKARWRITRLCAAVATQTVLYDTYLDQDCETTRDYLGTLSINPNGPTLVPPQYTLLNLPGAKFVTDGVAAGDMVRLNFRNDPITGDVIYDEYAIDSVLSQQSAVLLTGPTTPILVPTKIMIVRVLTKDAQRDELITYAKNIKNRRVTLFFPDVFSYLGTQYNGYNLAAMIGGFTCTLPPQQGFTNIEVVGADNVSRTIIDFGEGDLDMMAEAGIWIMTQQGRGSPVYSRHELTTDPTNINYREDMVTRNVDSISYYFMSQLSPFIGRYNVTPETVEALRATILGGIDYLKSTRISQLGGQVLANTSLVALAQHPTLKDRVQAKISLDVPYPMNNIDLSLVV